jgi:patatin-like phospholipase/acyl hydrolase
MELAILVFWILVCWIQCIAPGRGNKLLGISSCEQSSQGPYPVDAPARGTRTMVDGTSAQEREKFCRILSLDGGGAKGFYTLGVLREIEGMIGCRLHERFDLIFGASTGAIIAALLALGRSVDEIHKLYKDYVPTVMERKKPAKKSEALRVLAADVFKETKFDAVKTGVGIVATKWVIERPMIFKGSIAQAHGRTGTFTPGFGVTISDAVQASCSAYPFFDRKTVTTAAGDRVELVDGGYCANNPTLYAIADALIALKVSRDQRGGPDCLNRFSASISGASARVRLPSGVAAG